MNLTIERDCNLIFERIFINNMNINYYNYYNNNCKYLFEKILREKKVYEKRMKRGECNYNNNSILK
jgi:hypothetical protein